jgi:hypothetical protein
MWYVKPGMIENDLLVLFCFLCFLRGSFLYPMKACNDKVILKEILFDSVVKKKLLC